jgi:hypothetical protein
VEILESIKRETHPGVGIAGLSRSAICRLWERPPAASKSCWASLRHNTLFKDEEREAFHKALKLIFDGLAWADVKSEDSPDHPFNSLNTDTKQALLGLLTRLLPPRNGDIERVSFLDVLRTERKNSGGRR